MGLTQSCLISSESSLSKGLLRDAREEAKDELPLIDSPHVSEPKPLLTTEVCKPSMPSPSDALDEHGPALHREVDLEIPEDSTPDDAEGSLLSDPRFSAFLVQSPSVKYFT